MATTTTKSASFDKRIITAEVPNHELLKLAYDSYLAANRTSAAHTKTRGEISGGGKKPWRQKGTGRARFGSTRNPIWRTGGIVFGPRGNENYTKRISKQSKLVALRQALTLADKAGKLKFLDAVSTPNGKTKELLSVLKSLYKSDRDRILLVVDKSNKTDLLIRASANLANVKLVSAKYLNVYDILNADVIVTDTKAVDTINEWLGVPS